MTEEKAKKLAADIYISFLITASATMGGVLTLRTTLAAISSDGNSAAQSTALDPAAAIVAANSTGEISAIDSAGTISLLNLPNFSQDAETSAQVAEAARVPQKKIAAITAGVKAKTQQLSLVPNNNLTGNSSKTGSRGISLVSPSSSLSRNAAAAASTPSKNSAPSKKYLQKGQFGYIKNASGTYDYYDYQGNLLPTNPIGGDQEKNNPQRSPFLLPLAAAPKSKPNTAVPQFLPLPPAPAPSPTSQPQSNQQSLAQAQSSSEQIISQQTSTLTLVSASSTLLSNLTSTAALAASAVTSSAPQSSQTAIVQPSQPQSTVSQTPPESSSSGSSGSGRRHRGSGDDDDDDDGDD